MTPNDTTAPGLLSDGEALTIFKTLQQQPAHPQATAMAQALGVYRDAKQAQGLKPFQEPPAEQLKRTQRFESLYASLDGVDAQLPAEQKTALDSLLKTSARSEMRPLAS